tara:strand:- start:76 stop:321 length:246 start_codon:yes stop_codon:yes gene_type:complete
MKYKRASKGTAVQGDPKKAPTSRAVSPEAKQQVEFVRKELAKRVPDATPSEDFLVKVASTYFLSKKNPTVLAAAVKQLQRK